MQKLFILLSILLISTICYAQEIRTSFKQGFARNATESAHPRLWKGLIGAWQPSLGLTGNTLFDISGRGSHGALTNMDAGTDWVIGGNSRLPGYALDFDIIDDLINIGSPVILNNMPAFTISQWIFPNSEGEVNQARFFEKRSGTSGWGLNFSPSGINGLEFVVEYTTTNLQIISNDNIITLSAWNHAVLTWDGSPTATNVHIYVNGTEVGYGTQQNASGSRDDDASNALIIGNNALDQVTFDGLIGDSLIYNRNLTPTEIKFLYENPMAPFQLRPRLYKAPAIVSTRRVILISQLIDELYFDYLWN